MSTNRNGTVASTGRAIKGSNKKKRPRNHGRASLTRGLGLEGWEHLEPLVLAALASGDPMLLIGKHGTAKSFLLERLAQSLDLEFRFYNASIVNYDDLVGIPIPNESQTALHYISTPSSIWDAEVVFVDEISRARPEFQNKLFPIIHERRVQGVPLEKLRYRWAAMNPPPGENEDEEEEETVYHGAEPLDPALADRFAFIIEVPEWNALTDKARKRVLLDQFRGPHKFPVPIHELVRQSRNRFESLTESPPDNIADYLITVAPLAAKAGHEFSTRRMTQLLRNMLAVHAARMTLVEAAGRPDPDWEDTVWLALRYGLPGLAHGVKCDASRLLAAHRHAWKLHSDVVEEAWRKLLSISDPVDRLVAAMEFDPPLNPDQVGKLLTAALAAQKEVPRRRAFALVAYLALRDHVELSAPAVETLAMETRDALQPPVEWNSATNVSETIRSEARGIVSNRQLNLRQKHCRNLVLSLYPDGFGSMGPAETEKVFNEFWEKFALPDQ